MTTTTASHTALRLVALPLLLSGAVALAGCGSSPEARAHSAGEHIGKSLGSIQDAATVLGASHEVTGINRQIVEVRKDLPAAANQQLDAIQIKLRQAVDTANVRPSGLVQASYDASQAFDQLAAPADSPVSALQRGVQEGYRQAIN